jgi:hypothetical protein
MANVKLCAVVSALIFFDVPTFALAAPKNMAVDPSSQPCNGTGWGGQCECIRNLTGEGNICSFRGQVSDRDVKILEGLARKSRASSTKQSTQ